jgi:hypothetical protein
MFGRLSQNKIHLDIPYYSQWETPELIDDIIDRKILPNEDANWKKSGAVSLEEYVLWSWNLCGMACLKMILKSRFAKEYKLIDLAKKCQEYGGYEKVIDYTQNKGLIYKPFCVFIKKEFNLDGQFRKFLTIKRIKKEVSKGNYVIASVNAQIRKEDKEFIPAFKGGHLILFTGYDTEKKTLTFHNPSGYFNKTQQDHEVSEELFKSYFAGRGIIIKR